MLPQNNPDGIRIAFDDHRLVANAGLILPATLALRLGLGLPQLVDRHLDLGNAPGRANTGDKMMTLVASALAGGDCKQSCMLTIGQIEREGYSQSTICRRLAGLMDRTSPPGNPLHLQLADLLVQAGDQGGVVPGLLVLAVAENAGGALHQSLLPGLNLPGMDFIPGGQLGHRLLALHRFQGLPLRRQGATLALKAGLCFLRPCDISCSFPTATAAFSLGVGLSLRHLSEIPGPPQLNPGDTYLDVPEHLRRYRSDIFDDKYVRLSFDGLSRTITAHIANDGYWYIHPRGEKRLGGQSRSFDN